MVLLKSKIRWLALMGLALSALSLATHFLLARFFARDDAIAAAASISKPDVQAFMAWRSSDEDRSHGKAWSRVKEFRGLRPYAAARKAYPPPTGVGNGYLFARIYGEFHEIRASICDLVVVARLLNATLVLPELQEVTSAKGISSKFKGFGYIFNEQHFITALKRDILVVKNPPEKFKAAKRQKALILKSPSSSSSPKMYLNEVLPALKRQGAVSLMISGGGCLQSVLPPHLVEYQRLRCRVAFEALQFRHEVQELGSRMVQRLQALGQPYLAFHTGLERDSLAFHGCAERFQDVHTQLIQYKRALMIKEGLVIGNLSVDSELQWQNGSCPLMPEEVGVLLRALGYGPHTRIYISGAEVFGGQRVLIPLRAMFSNLEDRTTLTTAEERAMMYGPEEALPPPPPPPPPPSPDDVKRMIAAWQVAGPRPRPLPPPPGRNLYTHELEGWWGWVANSDKEPPPSIADLRLKGHKLLWAALDYIVCVESTAFFPGFDHDGKGRPNFASIVMGHRAYISPSLRTYRPNRKEIAQLLRALGDKLYHPKWSWVLSARNNLTASMGDAGLTMANHNLKPNMFLSNPLPECTCRLTEHSNASLVVKQDRKHQALSGDYTCPSWMDNDTEAHWTGDVDEEQEVEPGMPEEAELAHTGSEGDEPISISLDKVDKEDVQTEGEEDDTSD